VAVSFVLPVSVSLSASPRGTLQLSPNRLLQNFVLGLFSNIFREYLSLLTTGQKYQQFTWICMQMYDSILLNWSWVEKGFK